MKNPNKKFRILIPNGTCPTNIGDLAILSVLVNLIRINNKGAEIILHSSDPKKYPKNFPVKAIKESIYSKAVLSEKRNARRVLNMCKVVIFFLIFLFKLRPLHYFFMRDELFKLFIDYQQSNQIFYVGGGYLRSKKGLTQALNLLMQLFPIQLGKITGNRTIICPISFGPFGYAWQQKISTSVLKHIGLISAREKISYELMKKEGIPNILLSSDHALLLNSSSHPKKASKEIVLGLTVKKWLSKSEQLNFERVLANAILPSAIKHKLIIQPIAQVVNKKYDDVDDITVLRLCKFLKNENIVVNKIIKIKSLSHAIKTYSKLDALIGMRMHSNIIAATQGVPFLAVAYEHKTTGVAKNLGLTKFSIKIEDLSQTKVEKILNDLILNRKLISKRIASVVEQIKNREFKRWATIISI